MLDILACPSSKIPTETIFDVSFENSAVGATSVIDKVSGQILTATATNIGSVVDDPSMGKCFNFTGLGGFRFADSRSLPVIGKKIRITMDLKPTDTQNRPVLYTGSYDRVRIPGWNVCINGSAAVGDHVWIDQGSAYVSASIPGLSLLRRAIEVRMGLGYGTSITSNSTTRTTTALDPVNGGVFYFGTVDSRSGRLSFNGLVKSVKIESVPG